MRGFCRRKATCQKQTQISQVAAGCLWLTLGDSDRFCVADAAPWLKPGAPLRPVLWTFAVCQLESDPSSGLLHAKHLLKIAW